MVPGFMCDARVFFHQIVSLSLTRAVQVCTLPVLPSVEDMGAEILQSAPQRFSVVGLGLGGTVALDLMRRAPDRVERAALISVDPLAETPANAAARETRIVAARAGRVIEAARGEVPAAALYDGPGRDAVTEVRDDMARTLGGDVFVQLSRVMQRRPDQQKTLRRAMVPALVLAGEYDTITPPRRQEFTAQMMPHASFQVISRAGHLPPLEQPEAVSEALEAFLDSPLLLR